MSNIEQAEIEVSIVEDCVAEEGMNDIDIQNCMSAIENKYDVIVIYNGPMSGYSVFEN